MYVLAGELLRSCMDASVVERIDWGVPALEAESLVGDKDLARSEKSISTRLLRGDCPTPAHIHNLH